MHKKTETTTLTTLTSVKPNSFLIIEDIISMKEREASTLREGINYVAHHKKCKIFCVTHTVYKTGLYSMLPLFHYIIFTNNPANTPIIKQVLELFGSDKRQAEVIISDIRKRSSPKHASPLPGALNMHYYYFNCGQMIFGETRNAFQQGSLTVLHNSSGDQSDQSNPEPQAETLLWHGSNKANTTNALWQEAVDMFSLFFEGKKNRPQATAVFKLICNRLAPQHVNISDLTISFRTRESRTTRNISLVDYIACLLTESAQPTLEQRVLHNYLTRVCTIPATAIANKILKQRPNDS